MLYGRSKWSEICGIQLPLIEVHCNRTAAHPQRPICFRFCCSIPKFFAVGCAPGGSRRSVARPEACFTSLRARRSATRDKRWRDSQSGRNIRACHVLKATSWRVAQTSQPCGWRSVPPAKSDCRFICGIESLG